MFISWTSSPTVNLEAAQLGPGICRVSSPAAKRIQYREQQNPLVGGPESVRKGSKIRSWKQQEQFWEANVRASSARGTFENDTLDRAMRAGFLHPSLRNSCYVSETRLFHLKR